jgi:hypothetical protein
MTKGISIKRQFHVRRGCNSQRQVRSGATPTVVSRRIPRISRLMALAIRFDQLIRDGVVTDQAELAQLGRVSRPRLSQIMNLVNLAPEIQEELLQHSRKAQGRNFLSERLIRPIAGTSCWGQQRRMWANQRGV